MIEESNSVALWRNSYVPDPAPSLIKNFAYWVFQPVPACNVPDNCKIITLGSPVRPLNLIDYFARCASRERHPCQCPYAHPSTDGMTVQQNCHLAGCRNGHQLSSIHSQSA